MYDYLIFLNSIILGCSSIILALLGAEAYIACYNRYLSLRDKESFQKCIDKLKLNNRVNYETFTNL